ncbi:MAG: spiro-SPASM protein [Treponema sp.]|jgi:spiro-SPASM protein|nr:spiro-SPASM protein [Treponema sp.]
MNALCVLYGGSLTPAALEPLFEGKTALGRCLERAAAFPGVSELVLLVREGAELPVTTLPVNVRFQAAPVWTQKRLLETLSELSPGFDLSYYAWADCPLLDPELAGALAERHIRYAAEYSYADGWPYGFAPELLAPGTAGILAKILGEDGPVERDSLFAVLQKDINSFDIETEISPQDLRSLRLSLAADSRRNLSLLRRLMEAGLSRAADAGVILAGKGELLRVAPAFYAIQVAAPCSQDCVCCPYPRLRPQGKTAGSFMPVSQFKTLLDRIRDFSGEAVIDISLWGEVSLHPEKLELINAVLERPELSLIIETSGRGWKSSELEALAAGLPQSVSPRPWLAPPSALSWIVSLDSLDPKRYGELRGPGFEEALETARTLLRLFPGNAYVQALRLTGSEDDTEHFYRTWQAMAASLAGPGRPAASIIIQKYDDFCGFLEKKQAADLSPVKRHPCWHLNRDMNILLDGRVPQCREDLALLKDPGNAGLGNVFREPLETIWDRGAAAYRSHCAGNYAGELCEVCDEYYTFNF